MQTQLQQPSSPELEKCLLGMLFMYRDDIPEIANIVSPEHFYLGFSQTYFKVLVDMSKSSLDFDPEIMAYRMTQFAPGVSKAQTLDFILDCTGSYVSGHPAELASEIVNLWKRRKYIQECQKLATLAFDSSTHIDEVDTLAAGIMAVQGQSQDGNLKYADQYVNEFMEHMHSDEEPGLRSRFAGLQNRLGGYEGGNSYWIAAAEKMGKSAFMVSEAHHLAKSYPDKVGIYFSLEMSHKLLTRRLISIDTGIDIRSLKNKKLSDLQWKQAFESATWLQDSGLVIDATGGITPDQVAIKCQQVISERGQLDYIIFDYFQIAGYSGKAGNENEKHVAVSRELHNLIKMYDIPLIGGAQVVSKSISNRADMRPLLSDIRGSSALQADAYWVGALFRESYYEPELYEHDPDGKRKTELITRASREGESGTDYLQFFGECSRFEAARYETFQL